MRGKTKHDCRSQEEEGGGSGTEQELLMDTFQNCLHNPVCSELRGGAALSLRRLGCMYQALRYIPFNGSSAHRASGAKRLVWAKCASFNLLGTPATVAMHTLI